MLPAAGRDGRAAAGSRRDLDQRRAGAHGHRPQRRVERLAVEAELARAGRHGAEGDAGDRPRPLDPRHLAEPAGADHQVAGPAGVGHHLRLARSRPGSRRPRPSRRRAPLGSNDSDSGRWETGWPASAWTAHLEGVARARPSSLPGVSQRRTAGAPRSAGGGDRRRPWAAARVQRGRAHRAGRPCRRPGPGRPGRRGGCSSGGGCGVPGGGVAGAGGWKMFDGGATGTRFTPPGGWLRPAAAGRRCPAPLTVALAVLARTQAARQPLEAAADGVLDLLGRPLVAVERPLDLRLDARAAAAEGDVLLGADPDRQQVLLR